MSKAPISVLAVDDDASLLEVLTGVLQQEGYEVQKATDGISAINAVQSQPFDIVLLDIKMPRVDGIEVLRFIKGHYLDCEVIMLTGAADIKTAVECLQAGAFHYVTKPYSIEELLTVIDRALERRQLLAQNKILKSELERHAFSDSIVSRSKAFLDVLNLAARVAPTDSTVLIQGSSGTGKELLANFLHANSPRKTLPMVALNCSSIPETLIESELFGHERGSFTDAIATKQGLVEIANGGTLFLDEVAEISTMVQPKILRFLQTGEYRRVGGAKVLKSDVRIISATNKDLRQEVAAGRFREDLLYRLNVITLTLPPLRERKEDVPLLVEHFVKKHRRMKEPKRVDEQAMALLGKYDWPGNVRELENVIERAIILSRDNIIRVDDLSLPIGPQSYTEPLAPIDPSAPRLGSAVLMVDIEKAHIHGVLNSVSWNKNIAAKILGISLKTLYTKIRQYDLTKG
ncbi:MAG TPA: sigma-54-dependent Fis family transcriptional regulator [Bacteroidetes bacterium]|nr:sigma-54-dependent Fis family transcriptional regulator [Bacteroidota bacterium]